MTSGQFLLTLPYLSLLTCSRKGSYMEDSLTEASLLGQVLLACHSSLNDKVQAKGTRDS